MCELVLLIVPGMTSLDPSGGDGYSIVERQGDWVIWILRMSRPLFSLMSRFGEGNVKVVLRLLMQGPLGVVTDWMGTLVLSARLSTRCLCACSGSLLENRIPSIGFQIWATG